MADSVIFKTGNIEQKEPAKVKGQILFSVNNAGKGEIYFDNDENTRIRMSGNTAEKLVNSSGTDYSLGSTGKPVYFSNGVPVECEGMTNAQQAIPYIIGPTTDTTAGTWTGAHDSITTLVDGLTIIYVPAVAGASTTTLNLNGLGAKTCYLTNTTKLTTHFSAGTPIMLTYISGTWKRADYNSDNKVRQYLTSNTTTAYPILFRYNTTTPTNSGKYTETYSRFANTITATSTGTLTAVNFVGKLTGNATTADIAKALDHNVTLSFSEDSDISGSFSLEALKDGNYTSSNIVVKNNSHDHIWSNITDGDTILAPYAKKDGSNVSGTWNNLNIGGNAATATTWKTGVKLGIDATAGSSTIIVDGDEGTSNTTFLQIPATISGFTSISSNKFIGILDGNAKTATSATNANHATTADSATEADHANTSTSASTAGLANKATALENPQQMQVALGSTTAAIFDGTGNATIGVSGILGVPNGGTGKNTLALGEVLVGNGADAVSTKKIDTSVTASSTNLITSGAVATYAPSRTGSGASGNWGINITGSAGSLSAKPTINGTEFDGTKGITTTTWGPKVSFTTTDGTNTSTIVTSTGESTVNIKLPSTIKATLQGKATSAGTADNATNADYATSAGTATSAGKLTNKIKIDLLGDVTGSSVDVDLSDNVTISTTVANDSHNHTLSTITDSNTLAKKDGSNATGTWGIGITGNASTATTLSSTLAIDKGGTGATTKLNAKGNLGISYGTSLPTSGMSEGDIFFKIG